MSSSPSVNPYSHQGRVATAAALAPAVERAAFLRRVYSLVLAGVLTFAATLWAAGNVDAVAKMMLGLWGGITRTRFGGLVYFGITMGGFALVRAVAARSPINLVAYFGWAFLLGLLMAPVVLAVAHRNPDTLNTAVAVTIAVFVGLTAIVLVTGKDFSFLRGALMLGFWVLLLGGIAGSIWGFGSPLLWSLLSSTFFAAYILYDTSEVLHRYPTTMAVAAAVELFTDIVYLFRYVLALLNRRN